MLIGHEFVPGRGQFQSDSISDGEAACVESDRQSAGEAVGQQSVAEAFLCVVVDRVVLRDFAESSSGFGPGEVGFEGHLVSEAIESEQRTLDASVDSGHREAAAESPAEEMPIDFGPRHSFAPVGTFGEDIGDHGCRAEHEWQCEFVA